MGSRTTCPSCSMARYIVFVQWVTIFVAAVAIDPVANLHGDSRQKWKLFEQNPTNDEDRESNLEFQRYWAASMGNRMNNDEFFEKFDESIAERTVLFSSDECIRYCIGNITNKDQENFQYINLFWTANVTDITDDLLSKGLLRLMPPAKRIDAQDSNNNHKCQIYLDLDCNATEAGTARNHAENGLRMNVRSNEREEDESDDSSEASFPIKIVEKYNLSGHTETRFSVDTGIRRIIINVDGNVSNAVLRVPTGHGTTISWTRKSDSDGVRIDTRNAPPGEWWMKLVGEEDSKYRFYAEGYVQQGHETGKLFHPEARNNGNVDAITITKYRSNIRANDDQVSSDKEKSDDIVKRGDSEATEQRNLDATINFKLVKDKKINRERSLERRTFVEEQSDQTTEENSNDSDSSMTPSSAENAFVNYAEYVNFVSEDRTTSRNHNDGEKSSERMFSIEEQEKIHARSSVGIIENLDIDKIRKPITSNVNASMRMVEALENRELTEESVNDAKKNIVQEKRMLVEVNRNSNLLVTPGTVHRVVFDVMNNCVLPVRYAYRVKSTPFAVYNVQPPYAWIYPGQTSNVAVDLIVPDNIAPDTANTVTLFILGTEIKEKSVYLYVQGSVSKLTDDVKPKIDYSFNNNCIGKLEKDRCYKSRWSMDITIQDYDSGLKRVISSPNDIYPRTEFISGTRSPITFYYSATCCDKTAKITAIDLLNNYNTYTVDVTVWNNLSEAEIAAITMGTMFALLLVILVIILIIYCFRRRKSHDLPYTQRYGSRPPMHAERTSF